MAIKKGIYAASLSVLDDNLALNVKKTIDHAENLIDIGCHGVAIFGSTGQAQLISISEKVNLLTALSTSKFKDKYIIGTGLNSLNETINLMRVAKSLSFNKFLIMPPAFYRYEDNDVINFYGVRIIRIHFNQIHLLSISVSFANFNNRFLIPKPSVDPKETLLTIIPKSIIDSAILSIAKKI